MGKHYSNRVKFRSEIIFISSELLFHGCFHCLCFVVFQFTAHRDLVEYILTSTDAIEMLFSLRFTMIPDERWPGNTEHESKQYMTVHQPIHKQILTILFSFCVYRNDSSIISTSS